MIPTPSFRSESVCRKPRASGDDPAIRSDARYDYQ